MTPNVLGGFDHLDARRAGGGVVMGDDLHIDIDLDRRCASCHKPGATQTGLCLRCVGDVIVAKLKKQQEAERTEEWHRQRRARTGR